MKVTQSAPVQVSRRTSICAFGKRHLQNQSQRMHASRQQRMHAESLKLEGKRFFDVPVLQRFFDLAEQNKAGYHVVARVSDSMLGGLNGQNFNNKPIGNARDGVFDLGSRGYLTIPFFEGPKPKLDRWILDRLAVPQNEAKTQYKTLAMRKDHQPIVDMAREDLCKIQGGLVPKGIVAIRIHEPTYMGYEGVTRGRRVWRHGRKKFIRQTDQRIVSLTIIPPRDLYDLGAEFRFLGQHPMAVGINFLVPKTEANFLCAHLRDHDGRHHLNDIFLPGQTRLPPPAERLAKWILDGFFRPLVRERRRTPADLILLEYLPASSLEEDQIPAMQSRLIIKVCQHAAKRHQQSEG